MRRDNVALPLHVLNDECSNGDGQQGPAATSDSVHECSGSSTRIEEEIHQNRLAADGTAADPLMHNMSGEPNTEDASDDPLIVAYANNRSNGLQFGHEANRRGEKQPPACKNAIFGILFLMQLITIIGFAVTFVAQHWHPKHSSSQTDSDDYDDDDDDNLLPPIEGHHFRFPQDWIGLVLFFSCIGSITLILSIVLFIIYSECTQNAVRASLIVAPGIVLCVGIHRSSMLLLVSAIVCLYWTSMNWPRIPFAAANLQIATLAVNEYSANMMVAVIGMLLSFLWVLTWFMAVTEVSHRFELFGEDGRPVFWMLSLLLLSMFWTWQAIAYTLYATIAGVVGDWSTTSSEGQRFFAVMRSFGKSMTYSFGSICLGALVISSIQSFDYTVYEIRKHSQQRRNLCCCLLQFFFIHLEAVAQYVNKWAFVYVGVYGYGFGDASKVAYDVFKSRGCWSIVASNHVVGKIIATMNISNATIAGVLGVCVHRSFPSWLHAFASPDYKHVDKVLEENAFWLAFLCAYLLSSIMSRIVLSAVDTIIVRLAECPDELERNQPELFAKLKEGWDVAFPNAAGIFDRRDNNSR